MSDLKQICETINSFPKGEYLTGEFPPNGDYDNYLTTDQLQDLTAKLKLAVEALAVSGENFRALLRCPDWSCSECAALVETYTEDIDKALKQIGEQQK